MRINDIGSAQICYLDYDILHVTTEIGKTKSQYTRSHKACIADRFVFSISGSTINYIKREIKRKWTVQNQIGTECTL